MITFNLKRRIIHSYICEYLNLKWDRPWLVVGKVKLIPLILKLMTLLSTTKNSNTLIRLPLLLEFRLSSEATEQGVEYRSSEINNLGTIRECPTFKLVQMEYKTMITQMLSQSENSLETLNSDRILKGSAKENSDLWWY